MAVAAESPAPIAVPLVSEIQDTDSPTAVALFTEMSTALAELFSDPPAEEVPQIVTSTALPDGQAIASPVAAQPEMPAVNGPDNIPASSDHPADEEVDSLPGPAPAVVHTDYGKAFREAAEDRKLLFIYFYESSPNAANRAFEQLTLADEGIQEQLKRYVVVKLPRDTQIKVDGQSITLLKHPAFAEMLGRQGVAILDLAHERADYYRRVVSSFPFTP
ncbi:MAG TPA: hypothetical protein VHV08_09930, partial [Pirellulales bacterium]|nr:hypothetical protein [Pirellulales bacterium]